MRRDWMSHNLLNEENSPVCRSAETYVEQRLYELCSVNERKKQIYYEWQTNKQRFTKQTQTIIYDFQYYSLHDQSHSRSIIESIEMFLGKERVNKLGIGDLWLLLNCAYSHDIGMSMWHEEILEMWRSNKDFHRYIEKEVNNMDSNAQEALQYYWQLRNIIAAEEQMKGIEKNRERILKFEMDWPVYIRKYVSVITGEYIRRRHAERSKIYLDKFLGRYQDFLGMNVAENRLYQLMGKIAYAHSQDLSYILNELEYEANGFGNEKLHPQFVAAMLCLGDLLDMDNNRFDPYAIKHFGELPAISEIHLKKHLSITHLRITEFEVEARAESKNMAVCGEAQKWFSLLRDTLNWITSNWNIVVPEEMGGCTFHKHELKVYLDGEEFNDNTDKIFRVDKYKLIDLIIGEHLYSSKWVWIREYLQNAMDATKVMLWIQAKEGTEKIFKGDDFPLEKSTPMQMNTDKLEEYAIEFVMEFISPEQWKCDENYVGQVPQEEMIRFRIIDRGIGLEKESLEAITTIGTGWRGRESYQSEMQEILEWLRPTGGFGIGLQAGFMVADEIEIITKGLRDTKGYKVILKSPRIGGSISTITNNEMKFSGTCISMMIPVRNIQTLKDRNGKTISVCADKGYFTYEDICSELYYRLWEYIREIIPNNMIPIRMKLISPEGIRSRMLYGKFFPAMKNSFDVYENRYQIQYITDYVNDVKRRASEQFLQLWIWDMKDQVSMQLILRKAQDRKQENEAITLNVLNNMGDACDHMFCFKNVEVREGVDKKSIWIPNVTTLIDFMGIKAEGCLKVNRDKFNENFNAMSHIHNILHVCAQYLVSELRVKNIMSDIFSELSFRYLLLWDVLTNTETGYKYNEEIKSNFNRYYLIGKKFKNIDKEKNDAVTHEEETINIDYGWIYDLVLQKKDLVVFEISSEFEATEEVAFRNIEKRTEERDKWDGDDVADYVMGGGRVLCNAMLYKLFKENTELIIEQVKINELGKTFGYIASWNNQKKQSDNSTFQEAVMNAIMRRDTKLEFSREDQRYHDLVMKKPLSYLAESDLDWRNQNVILLPFSKSDYFMIIRRNSKDGKTEHCSKSTFLETIKRNAVWKRAVEYAMMQQSSTFRKSREIIEQEYEEVCGLIYDAANNLIIL
ncbi:MAG: hypothetical protein NC548_36120 [Lachnospiraceae bacterium]|nr:hypothetical protein [Lachnospiraceae bacterium]